MQPHTIRITSKMHALRACHTHVRLQEATDTYKALLLEHRELLALNVYVALCYAKLDYYDVSSEILQVSHCM